MTDVDAGKPAPGRFGSIAGAVAGFARRAADLVLPPLCLSCSAPVAGHGVLCARCWNDMHFIARPYCQRLGTPFEADLGMDLISPRAVADPPVFGRARGVARYDDTARHLVHRLKYSDRMDIADAMGRWMAHAGAEILSGADALVPVPLHRYRLMKRRFNQAGELARAVSRVSGVPVMDAALQRVKATPSQVGLSADQRRRNLAGAFAVPDAARPRVSGQRLVLIDDVMTTTATLNASARALRRAGAGEVDALVFAIVAESA